MKKVILSSLLFFFAFSLVSFSQDILYKQDGTREEVKVKEITNSQVSYTKFSNPDGPVYVVPREEVVLITYANGDYELVTPLKKEVEVEVEDWGEPTHKEKSYGEDLGRNIFALHIFDVIFGDFAISYEHIVAEGHMGIKIPIAFGFYGLNPGDTPFDFNNLFYSGIGFNFYPTGQGKWRYFLGPNFRVGVGRSGDYYYGYDEYGNYIYDMYNEKNSFYMKYFIDNGVMFTPVKNLSISAILSVGIRYISNPPTYMNRITPDAQFAINMGLRF